MTEQLTFEFDNKQPIKGFPELRWTGKRPYRSTTYYPAQIRERYGVEQSFYANGKFGQWVSRLYWGDNLQVMSHLMKDFRGQVDLIYIDPPFDSKADYKKKIALRGQTAMSDSTALEEKQYGDIWTNDEYLQFMFERLILMKELLADTGSIFLHCDWRKSQHLRLLMDEVFSPDRFVNEIIWCYTSGGKGTRMYARKHDNILFYTKTPDYYFDVDSVRIPYSEKTLANYKEGLRGSYGTEDTLNPLGKVPEDFWEIAPASKSTIESAWGYPTQKPIKLLERIIKGSSPKGGLVFDCFMGSGTTQAVAMKLGRRFIGADINLGAIQTTTKRLISIAAELNKPQLAINTGFEVYNVNNYEFFRNPVEARQLIIDMYEIQPFPAGNVYDGELDGRMVKIMPVNRITTPADLEELKANLPYKTFEKRKEENPAAPVERITIICMGHTPDLKGSLEFELSEYKVDIEIVDILRDPNRQFKRDSEADVAAEGGRLVIRQFYPLNLMQKLSLDKEFVEDWRQLVESVMIDWNYDGAVMEPAVTDVPGKTELVKGIYDIPKTAGTIKIKITDLLSESLEVEVRV
ncbi:MAG: site-specific DNA-methyltransferase [Oscillospiraceae bacterium]|nr:site-specific DNA-methyltransferase [Oscillospiraceae bacterium]